MKRLFVLFVLFTATMVSRAQFPFWNADRSWSDISVSGGVYAIGRNLVNEVLGQGTLYAIDYGRFGENNLGVRGGINYINGLDTDIDVYQLPLAIAWSTPFHGRRNEGDDGYVGPSYEDSDFLTGLLLSIFPLHAELQAGLTPGFIVGDGFSMKGYSSWGGNYTDGIRIKKHFTLSADFGIRVSVHIWRINLFMHPTYHHWLTHNFSRTGTYDYQQPRRGYLSVKVGCGYLF